MSARPTTPRAMLSVAEARERILDSVDVLGSESAGLDRALGRVIAERVVAREAIPPFENSSMDGYAVRAGDVQGASRENPVTLRVIGDIAAGRHLDGAVLPGTAARIMTGAPLPEGADAVVPVESTDDWPREEGAPLLPEVRIFGSVDTGAYVRRAGQDIMPGDAVLEAGRVLRPADVGVLAALGYASVAVYRRPRVAIVSTGDELVDVSQTPGPGQIRNSNLYALAAMVEEAWGEPLLLGIARDEREAVQARLREGLAAGCDLFVSSAGVSVGTYDVVRAVIEAEGTLGFWRVNLRPGKPLAFGRVSDVPFFGLPGNPVSALLTFELFVRPALLKMGARPGERPRVRAALDAPLQSDGRESYLRAVVRNDGAGYRATLTGSQDSGVLTSLVKANALLIVPAGVEHVAMGDELEAILLTSS